MSATAWLIIAIVGFSLSGVALATAVFMFIKMNIPAIIGDLTGKTVAREIKAMRESNASSGDKRFRPSAVNLERGTLTEKVSNTPLSTDDLKKAHASKRLDKSTGSLSGKSSKKKGETSNFDTGVKVIASVKDEEIGANPTEMLSDNATDVLSDNATEELSDSNTTEVLSADTGATEVLVENGTEVLSEGTTVLAGGTTVLSQTEELDNSDLKPVAFKITKDIILIHSDEKIENV